MQDEQWKPIPGFEGYEASSLGRIASVKSGQRRTMRATMDRGYLRVTLRTADGGKSRRVHQFVAAAFQGPRPDGLEVRHLDGNPLNNRADNLLYGTRRENILDAVRHGTWTGRGVRTHCPQRHEYTAESSYVDRQGRKSCRTCRRAVNRAAYAARRASV